MGENDMCSWHDAKREATFQERGIDFADLRPFFDDGCSLVKEDDRRDYSERRYNMLASFEGVILNITFTPRGEKFHIISARMANRRERAIYAEGKANP